MRASIISRCIKNEHWRVHEVGDFVVMSCNIAQSANFWYGHILIFPHLNQFHPGAPHCHRLPSLCLTKQEWMWLDTVNQSKVLTKSLQYSQWLNFLALQPNLYDVIRLALGNLSRELYIAATITCNCYRDGRRHPQCTAVLKLWMYLTPGRWLAVVNQTHGIISEFSIALSLFLFLDIHALQVLR